MDDICYGVCFIVLYHRSHDLHVCIYIYIYIYIHLLQYYHKKKSRAHYFVTLCSMVLYSHRHHISIGNVAKSLPDFSIVALH